MANIDYRSLRILVIDDSRDMQLIVKSILSELGVTAVRVVSDAALGFQELQGFPADLIIVDWYVEPLDGLDFVRLVRNAKDSQNPYVPIIMLSGFTEHQRVAQARDAGVNEYLVKPVSVQTVASRISSVINNPRPLIRSKKYFGPCRRRNDYGVPRGMTERRLVDSVETKLTPRPVKGMSR